MQETTALDEIDLKIINSLSTNCRVPYRNIASTVGITPKAVKSRVNKMISQGVIQNFVVLINPVIFAVILLAIALLFVGIERIVHGVGNKERRGWARAFSIGVGVIALGVSIAIIVSPVFGARLVGVIVGLALLIIGIEMIIAGITGKRQQLLPTSR